MLAVQPREMWRPDRGEGGWFIIMTAPLKEAFVAESLQHLGYETVFLHELVRTKTGRELKRARWPRYVLLRPQEGQGLYDAAWHQAVVRFVSAAGEPCRLAHEFVEDLLADADEDGCLGWRIEEPIAKREERYEPGDVLRILVGPFQGLQAIVEVDNGTKIRTYCEGVPVICRPSDVKLVVRDAQRAD